MIRESVLVPVAWEWYRLTWMLPLSHISPPHLCTSLLHHYRCNLIFFQIHTSKFKITLRNSVCYFKEPGLDPVIWEWYRLTWILPLSYISLPHLCTLLLLHYRCNLHSFQIHTSKFSMLLLRAWCRPISMRVVSSDLDSPPELYISAPPL